MENKEDLTVKKENPTIKYNKKGTVSNCRSILRVRSIPNLKGQELSIVQEGEVLRISMTDSTENFYAVVTKSGIIGFCMKAFISLDGKR